MASGDNIDGIEVAETSFNLRKEDQKKGKENDEDEEEKEKEAGMIASGDVTATTLVLFGPKTSTTISRHKSEKERKIGHRRVGVGGEITYKKIQTTQIMGSIQLGIQHAVGGLASKPERDLLMQDFMTVETTNFPEEGSNHTPAHHCSEFRFRTYAPIAFRYFRDLFGIQPDDFLISMCHAPLRELSNPGASGSIFYLTEDDEFIIKTVQHKEGEFLQKLLPGYYMNLNQNPRTLLPKFFGLYCYQCNSKNVRLIAMNNLLPSYVKMHHKYDLKGSTYKRKASKSERQKKSPTYKDLDFMEHHPEGIGLEADTYNALVKTIQRDCRVLESFKIMDYSLLVGIHNLDLASREKATGSGGEAADSGSEAGENAIAEAAGAGGAAGLNRSRSINRQRLVAHSTAMESIQAESEPVDEEEDVPPGGIPARNARGERLLLFVGIIDILQSYRLKKKLEHTWKAMIHDGDTVSVHRPGFYAQRFQDFMAKTVFKKIPSPLKHSPSKRKSISRVAAAARGIGQDADVGDTSSATGAPAAPAAPLPPVAVNKPESPQSPVYPAVLKDRGPASSTPTAPTAASSSLVTSPVSIVTTPSTSSARVPPPVPPRGSPRRGQGFLPCSSTPPPSFEDALRGDLIEGSVQSTTSGNTSGLGSGGSSTTSAQSSRHHHHHHHHHNSVGEGRSSLSVESSGGRSLAWTPPASVEGSTPTFTEGTPSFTESSSSGDIGTPARSLQGGPKAVHSRADSLDLEVAFHAETVSQQTQQRHATRYTVQAIVSPQQLATS